MKIKALRFIVCFLTIALVSISCGDDDDGGSSVSVRDRTEQQLADKDSLLNYLSTHYYNSGFFATGENHRYSDIVITELPQDDEGNYLPMPDPENNTLLIEAIDPPRYTTYEDTEYEYYVLTINQGEGDAPNFTDSVRVRYEGLNVVSSEVFDSSVTPVEIPLQGNLITTFGAIRAWQLVMPTFNTGYVTGIEDGVVQYGNYGLGVMFVPSGLGYFSGSSTGTSYANLIFKFDLLQYQVEDHDEDGIPSFIEDLNSNLDVSDDDTDDDGFYDFIDADDDGDGVATIDELIQNTRVFNEGDEEPTLDENEYEIERENNEGVITITTVTAVDANSNGILDYLDDTATTNYNEEEE